MNQQVKDVFIPVIISKLHFLEIQRELFFGDTMKLSQPFLCIAPETLQAVDIDLAGGKALAVIHPQMPIPTEHQGIVAAELIRVDNGAAADRLDRHVQQTLGRDIPDHLNLHDAVSLDNPEDGDLPGRASSAFPLASASEVGLVQFDLAVHQQLAIQVGQDRPSQNRDGLERGRITQPDLLGDLPGGQLHLKKLNEPQPGLIRNSQPADPPARKIMERVAAPLTPVPLARDPVDFSAPTACTENAAIFRTRFFKEQSGSFFRFSDELKGLDLH